MIRLEWQGRACGANRRLMPGKNGRFFLNPRYKAFKESMALAFLGKGMMYGDVHLEIAMRINALMDSDSVLKPLFDSLEEAGVLENDRQVRSYTVRRENRGREESDSLTVLVEAIAEIQKTA
jgi:Holliday junction resolvase RusA-like endonuclease